MSAPTCDTCPFWVPADVTTTREGGATVSIGECRRYPPGAPVHGGGFTYADTTETRSSYWCGEHPERRLHTFTSKAAARDG